MTIFFYFLCGNLLNNLQTSIDMVANLKWIILFKKLHEIKKVMKRSVEVCLPEWIF